MYKAKQEGKGGHVVYRPPADGGHIGDLGVSEGGFHCAVRASAAPETASRRTVPRPAAADQGDRD